MMWRLVALWLVLEIPGRAAEATEHTDPAARVVLSLAIILLAAKFGGHFAARIRQPAVLGELVAGVILGNLSLVGFSGLEYLKEDAAVDMLSRIGVILLLFEVGLESTVGQMMKVIGEEGTSIEEFVAYLKGEFFDAVYLQQNAFDKMDEATASDRQKYVFDLLEQVIDQPFTFDTKDAARRFFLELRQMFLTWNSTAFGSNEFKQKEQGIRQKLMENKTVTV